LRELEVLTLHGNKLSSLPPEFSSVTRLEHLTLSNNNFEVFV